MSATASSILPAIASEPIPPGYWQREISHAPRPISPLGQTTAFINTNSGFRRMFDELGVLPQTLEWRTIRGLTYTRVVPPGGKDRKAPPPVLVPLISRLAPAFRRSSAAAVEAIRTDRYGGYVDCWFAEWRDELVATIASLRSIGLTGLADAELHAYLRRVLVLLTRGIDVHFMLQGAYALMMSDLAFTCRDLLGWDDQRTLALMRGLSVASTQPARALAALAALARSRPAARALVARADASAAAALAQADPEFAAEFAAYVREFGFRSIRYEVIDPTLAETPELVLKLIRDQLATGYDPDADDADARLVRERALEQARAALAGDGLARFERALARAERIYPVREEYGPTTFTEPLALLRHAALEVGRRLVASGQLTRDDDAFFLERDELLAALSGEGAGLADVVASRRDVHQWALTNPGPASYGDPPDPPPSMRWLPAEARFVNEATSWLYERMFAPEDSARVQPADSTLSGISAATGSYTGPVRVIHGEAEFDQLQPGDVLVCPTTSPVWSLLFASVGALVTDTGGILSHPSIIAREYGIPAVVATGNATTVLRDGQLVTVDGSAGTVTVSV